MSSSLFFMKYSLDVLNSAWKWTETLYIIISKCQPVQSMKFSNWIPNLLMPLISHRHRHSVKWNSMIETHKHQFILSSLLKAFKPKNQCKPSNFSPFPNVFILKMDILNSMNQLNTRNSVSSCILITNVYETDLNI